MADKQSYGIAIFRDFSNSFADVLETQIKHAVRKAREDFENKFNRPPMWHRTKVTVTFDSVNVHALLTEKEA